MENRRHTQKGLNGGGRYRKENFEIRQKGDSDATSLWKSQILVIRYEDFALNPIILAERVYKFLGLNYPDEIKKTLETLTSPSSSSEEASNIILSYIS